MVKCHACFCLFVFQVCLGLSLVSNILAVLNDANFCWRTLLGFCQTCTGVVSLKEWYAILWNKCQRSHQCWTSVSDYSEKCPRSGNRGWVIQRLPRPNKTLWRQQTKIKWLWLLNRLNRSSWRSCPNLQMKFLPYERDIFSFCNKMVFALTGY